MSTLRENNLPEGILFSVAGARGIVGKGLDISIASKLAMAFCSVMGSGSVVVGRDTRPSGEAFKCAVMAAIMASGRDCIDLGIATTPTVEMAVRKLGASGGIIITASHNRIEWNALKFLDGEGIFIDRILGEELLRVFQAGSGSQVEAKRSGKLRTYKASAEDHIEAILSLPQIDPSLIRARNFSVVVDCINGAGSVIAPKLLNKLGVDVIRNDCKKDGDFHRDPEPRAENLTGLAKKVRRKEADLGFALDPDADRLALVDPDKGAISEEYTLALCVDHLLSHRKGLVVVNMSTSSIVEKIAERHGVEVVRTPVGEAHVVKAMLERNAVIGGEGNGGVILPALHPGRDGLLAMALILQFLSESKKSLSELIGSYPPFRMAKKKVPLRNDFNGDKIRALLGNYHPLKVDTRDGVRADFQKGWYHLRVSNTEGLIRIIAESNADNELKELLDEAQMILEKTWEQ